MKYEEALQIAIEELDEKIQCLSDTFNGHSARIESYIYDLSMARKALMQASGEKRDWVGLTEKERNELEDYCEMIIGDAAFDAIEAKLKEKNT